MSRPKAIPIGLTLEACLQWSLPELGWRKREEAQKSCLQLLLHSCSNSTALASGRLSTSRSCRGDLHGQGPSTQHLPRQASLTYPGAITKSPQGDLGSHMPSGLPE